LLEQWLHQEKAGRKGASTNYSDLAIKLMVTLQLLFNLPG
jgi:hypothetical protein